MYYIVNHTQHIIAADSSLLKLLSVENINALYTKIALGDITFTPSDEQVMISTVNGRESYRSQSHTLSGMLGDITLVEIYPSQEDVIEDVIEDKTEEEILILDDEPITFSDYAKEEVADTVEEKISFDDEPFDLMSDVETEVTMDEKTTAEEVEIKEEATVAEKTTVAESENDTAPIVVDIDYISQEIGISTDDYNNFLNEYIDTALTLEKDLESTEEKKRTHAIDTLSHLSNVLHLPVITKIIEQIKDASSEEQDTFIKSLYATLARLTTTQADTFKKADDFLVEDTTPTPANITTESFGTIDLSDVQPIHFDFQMEAAAEDLSLPQELIEEFVNDFIEQARTETEKMLELYEKGDLDAIQKIGHLLKGTASNLRINPLADTLYEIQFCEDSSKLEDLIKEYWGHFLAFETQISLSSNT
jgi:hypothetical protein